jgi:hypothetical protein
MSIDELEKVLALGNRYAASLIHWGSFKIAFKDALPVQPVAAEQAPSQSPAPDLAADDTSNIDDIRFWSSSDSSVPLAGDE